MYTCYIYTHIHTYIEISRYRYRPAGTQQAGENDIARFDGQHVLARLVPHRPQGLLDNLHAFPQFLHLVRAVHRLLRAGQARRRAPALARPAHARNRVLPTHCPEPQRPAVQAMALLLLEYLRTCVLHQVLCGWWLVGWMHACMLRTRAHANAHTPSRR